MNILVLNGSPKGKYSITLQTVLYLQAKFPEHTFEILHVGQTIKALEKDFSPALEAVGKADALLFSYPVYTFVAPCQLHRFIELLKASDTLCAYRRIGDGETLTVILNCCDTPQTVDYTGQLVISSYGKTAFDGTLQPWEAVILREDA